MYGYKEIIQEIPKLKGNMETIPITLLKYRAFCRIYPNPFVIEHIENETLPIKAHHFKDLIKV